MFMILILHADFFALGEPSTEQAIIEPLQTFGKIFFEMFALISVNLFVLISGWFSIKVTLQGALKFLFQCVFIITLMYAIGLCLGYATLNKTEVLECVFMRGNAWFVKSYLGLYILAPVLNAFVERVSEKELRRLLISFYIFQTFYGCIYYSTEFFSFGNSAFSFIGLYLLARYFRLYGERFYRYGISLWLISLLVSVIVFFVPLKLGLVAFSYTAIHYSSPTCVIGALGLLFMAINRKPLESRFINFVASSCFTVYLYHVCNIWTAGWYVAKASEIYKMYSGIYYFIVIGGFMICVFSGGIVIDQVRKFCWSIVSKTIFRKERCIKVS